jgi:hypothetical protein
LPNVEEKNQLNEWKQFGISVFTLGHVCLGRRMV